MRPVGEVAQALLKAAHELAIGGRGPTLAEMAARACVGQQVARTTVSNLKRCGTLRIVAERRVDYRNRPVAEYAPAALMAEAAGWSDLGRCMSSWTR